MLVVTRHVVAPDSGDEFLKRAADAAEVLAARPGCRSIQVVRAIDDPGIFLVVGDWVDVGSYRRALSSFEVKVGAVPLLATAADEPSAFEVLLAADATGTSRHPGDLAPDAHTAGPS